MQRVSSGVSLKKRSRSQPSELSVVDAGASSSSNSSSSSGGGASRGGSASPPPPPLPLARSPSSAFFLNMAATTTTATAGTAPLRNGSPAAAAGASAILPAALRGRERWLDWACVALLFVLLAVANGIDFEPPYIAKATLPTLSRPLAPNSVPAWSVPLLAIALPAALAGARGAALRLPPESTRRSLLGLLTAIALTGLATNLVKAAVRRPRPNFIAMCWPGGGAPEWRGEDAYGAYPVCSAAPRAARESVKSFPSGHSSWSAAGLGYLTAELLQALRPFDGAGHVWRLAAAALPSAASIGIGVSRYVDGWHHPSDIAVGLAGGFFAAWLCFRTMQEQQRVLPQQAGGGGSSSDETQALLPPRGRGGSSSALPPV